MFNDYPIISAISLYKRLCNYGRIGVHDIKHLEKIWGPKPVRRIKDRSHQDHRPARIQYMACYVGRLDLLKLDKHEIDYNLLFSIAGEYCRFTMLRYLLAYFPKNQMRVVNYSDAIVHASRQGHYKMVKYLHKLGHHHPYLLSYACSGGNLRIVKYLVKNGYDPSWMNNTCIFHAATSGQLHIVKYLYSIGCPATDLSNVAIRTACLQDHMQVVKFLIKIGCNASDFNNEAIISASRNGNLEMVKLLIANGCDPTAGKNRAIRSICFHQKVHSEKHLDVLKYLLQLGCDPTDHDNEAIISASRNGNIEIVNLLQSYGCKLLS